VTEPSTRNRTPRDAAADAPGSKKKETIVRLELRLSLALLAAGLLAQAAAAETTGRFAGPKANTGSAAFSSAGGQRTLTLSADFTVPDAPDPHWQVVDSKGAVYPLQRLAVKGDAVHRSIALPAYVPDVAKVQIWCAFAETLLGEAAFAAPVK
jgi:hypothetical protein